MEGVGVGRQESGTVSKKKYLSDMLLMESGRFHDTHFLQFSKTGKDLIQQKVSFTSEEKKETKEFDFQDAGTMRSLLQ